MTGPAMKILIVDDEPVNVGVLANALKGLSLIHISEPTRPY